MSKRGEQYMKVWMSQKEIKMIEKYLTPETIMLEYGSGGSTIHFSKFVKEYYSLEHNKEWYNKVKIKISNNDKITTFLSENKKMATPRIHADCWDNLEKSTSYTAYEEYVKYPSIINKKYDAVLVDGRARPECAKFIYDFLNEGAYVFIHDYWGRKPYHVVEEKYKVVDHIKQGQSLVVLQRKDNV